jgi:hypothetical protein
VPPFCKYAVMPVHNLTRTLLIIVAGVVALAPRSAAASEPTGTVVVMECSASGPAAAACAGVGLILHELAKGGEGFGPNGEIMKVLRAPVETIGANAQAAQRESGDIAKAARTISGISIADIENYGIVGGPNSELNKIKAFVERSLGIRF